MRRGRFPRMQPAFTFRSMDTAPRQSYSLSLHDALPILQPGRVIAPAEVAADLFERVARVPAGQEHAHLPRERDRNSTRLNSSHLVTSYAVFCLKKKNS